MSRGDHIFVRRKAYSHHGVDVGNGEVIHFNGEPGSKVGATIRRSPLEQFAGKGRVQTREYHRFHTADEVVARAESKLGESGYNLFNNNCEHFARWCVTGKHSSSQVNGAVSSGGAAAVSGAAAVGGVGLVSAAGTTSGLSAAGIMSGLAAIGPAGVVGGLVTVAALPGAISAGIVQVALKDDDALTPSERTARRVGRTTSVAGAAAGTVGGIAAVSSAGAVGGLSAAGITSGLAALGGSMAVGTSLVVAAPAVAAAGVGFISYRAARRISARRKQNSSAGAATSPVDEGLTAHGSEIAETRESWMVDHRSEADQRLDLLATDPDDPLDGLPDDTDDAPG